MKKELIDLIFKYGLIQTNFVQEKLVTLASGWKSPIYTDMRKAMAYPDMMEAIKRLFFEVTRPRKFDGIIAVAKGAIPHGTLLASSLELPMGYISVEAKDHGLGKQIEGMDVAGKNIFLIDDLVTTGKSLIKCVKILEGNGACSIFTASIFSYNLDLAKRNFEEAQVKVYPLVTIDDILPELKKRLPSIDYAFLLGWLSDPKEWYDKYYPSVGKVGL